MDSTVPTEDLDFIRRVVKHESGLDLGRDKVYLLESRLKPLMRAHGLKDLGDLAQGLRAVDCGSLIKEMAEALTTNESFFFRDGTPFDLFRDKILPALTASRAAGKSLRVWCAAAATGQEPYSLAIILKERAATLAGWRIEILATDISGEALARARAGVYSPFEARRGMPPALLHKYFDRLGDTWAVKPEIKSMVRFREHNLLDSPRAFGRFDVVFCRNVLIYFDVDTKRRVLADIRALMADDGALFLGGSETVLGFSEAFQPVPKGCGVYRPSPSGVAGAPGFPFRAATVPA